MQHYATDRWHRQQWQTATRYYIAEVTQDLFGEWQLHRCWGSRTSARGNEQHLPTASYEEALALLQATEKRRKQRGYQLTNVFSLPVLL